MRKNTPPKHQRFGDCFYNFFGGYYSNDAMILLSGIFDQNLSDFRSEIILFLLKINDALIAQEVSV